MALGLIAAGTGTGTVVLPPLSRYLISGYGWQTTYAILGLAIWLFVISASLVLRRDPEAMGLRPYGREAGGVGLGGKAGISFSAALRRRSLWVLSTMHLLTAVALQMVMTHLVNYATDADITPLVAASFVSFIGGTSVFGRVLVGGASDKIGKRRAFFICTAANTLAILWLTQASVPWMLYAFGVFFGFFYGGWIPMFPALAAELFGTEHLAAIYGVVSMASGIGGVIGPFLAGYLFDLSASYTLAFFLGALAMGLATLSVLFLGRAGPREVGQAQPVLK